MGTSLTEQRTRGRSGRAHCAALGARAGGAGVRGVGGAGAEERGRGRGVAAGEDPRVAGGGLGVTEDAIEL